MKKVITFSKETILNEINVSINAIKIEDIQKIIEAINNAEKIFCVGVGRVKIALSAWCKRLAHLGYKICLVGDLTEPSFGKQDLLIIGSGSGNSIIPVAIAQKAKQIGGKVLHIGTNDQGNVSQFSDTFIKIPVSSKQTKENKIISKQLMTSLFEQTLFILGDIVTLSIANQGDKDIDNYWEYHATLE